MNRENGELLKIDLNAYCLKSMIVKAKYRWLIEQVRKNYTKGEFFIVQNFGS